MNGVLIFRLRVCLQLTSSCYYGMRYSTTVSNDSDTHDDFKPANKLENSGISLSNVVEQVSIESHIWKIYKLFIVFIYDISNPFTVVNLCRMSKIILLCFTWKACLNFHSVALVLLQLGFWNNMVSKPYLLCFSHAI